MAKATPKTTPDTPEAEPVTRSVSGPDVFARLKVATSADAGPIADAEHYVSTSAADDRIAQNVAKELKRVKKL